MKTRPRNRKRLSVKAKEKAKEADKALFLKSLEKHLGIMSYAAQECNIPRRTVYDWIEKDVEFARAVSDMDGKQIDFVQRKLLENINNNDTRAITFYLSTKGRKAGYTNRVEFTTPDNHPIKAEVSFDVDATRRTMNDEALKKAIRAASKQIPDLFPLAHAEIERKQG